MSQLAEAVESFERTLADLGVGAEGDELADPAELGRRAALLAAGEFVWRRHLGALLSTKQVRDLMRIGSRQAISERVKRRRLLAVPASDGRPQFPAFQFTQAGRPLPGLHLILEQFAGAVATPFTTASWFVTPEPLLEEKTPAEWLRTGGSPDLAVEAASRYVKRLRR
jgi:hypothetical protein